MFNSNSFTVRFYVGKIKDQGFSQAKVPDLFNLQEEVAKLLV